MSESPASGFERIDPKLNVFALANGMDLAKDETSRRLEWFFEGFERGIVIRPEGEGLFALEVVAWRTGQSDLLRHREVGSGLDDGSLTRALADAIDAANGLDPSG